MNSDININNNKILLNKDISYLIKALRNNIKQKEDIETNLTIATDNYLDNIDSINEDYKQQNDNSINLSNISSFIDNNNNKNVNLGNQINRFDNYTNSYINKSFVGSSNQKNENFTINTFNTINTNKSSFLISPKIISDMKIKSPQEIYNNDDDEIEEINSSESNTDDNDINIDFLSEEKNNNVNELNNNNIKDAENIKKNKMKTAKNLEKNKKNFYFLKPFRPKGENKLLENELKKNNIDINDALILLKKNNFLEYLFSLENYFEQIKLNSSNNININKKDNISNIITLNKPLKEKENFDKEKNFDKTLNNFNLELILAITLGIEKCISSLDNYDLQDKSLITNILNQKNDNNEKTTKQKKISIFHSKTIEKFSIDFKDSNKNSSLDEFIYNYPFKKNKFIFEQTNTFSYSFYSLDKKDENDKSINAIKATITEYAPEIFCNIRYNLSGITNKNFLKSFNIENIISNIFLGNINNLSELLNINNEKYPEFIMFSPDTKYIVKCISENEFN